MRDFKNEEALNTLNHSCAHVLAQAVKHLYPDAKFWVGPVVSEGFYYDIDLGDRSGNTGNTDAKPAAANRHNYSNNTRKTDISRIISNLGGRDDIVPAVSFGAVWAHAVVSPQRTTKNHRCGFAGKLSAALS